MPAGYRGFLYAVEGSASIGAGGATVTAPQVAWFDPSGGDTVDILTITAERGLRAILCAGPPIEEPVVMGGPFVMNTGYQIRQAFMDFRTGRFLSD